MQTAAAGANRETAINATQADSETSNRETLAGMFALGL